MAELKTKKTQASVEAFLDSIEGKERREDCRTVAKMMKRATKAAPKMWGPSIVGFGDFRYKYESGREGDWFLAGFSPRKDALTLYLWQLARNPALLAKLGKHKTGKGCLYIKKLADIDLKTLEQLIAACVERNREAAP